MEQVEFDKKVEELIKKTNSNFTGKDLIDFLKIPSNTLNKKGIQQGKDFLLSYISDFCDEIREFEGEINPLILAKVEGQIKDSILIYMMYDTQPITNETEWISNPFNAEKKLLPEPLDKLGKCIIARGAYNSKTPLLCFLNIIKILKKTEELPLSLLLLFDGEEEIGSPSLIKFLENKKEFFKFCSDAYYPAAKQDLNGRAVLKLGYKGILSLKIKILSKNKETHSAYSSMIPNPAINLVNLINLMYSENKFNITSLKNPYIPSEQEEKMVKDLFNQIDIESIKQKAGITHTLKEDTREAFMNYLFNPTFNISTLKSGYLEEGTKNIVPNNAECNIDIRFAHDISIAELYGEIKNFVENYAKRSNLEINLTKKIGYEGSRVLKDSNLVRSLVKSFEKLDVQTEIWPLSAAAAPLSKIQKELGLNFIVGGLGIGGFAHSPNEFIQVDSILNMRLSNYYFLKIYTHNNVKVNF
ncbi:MAG: M20/M25/M40 family metallo-hydrolase [Candidatus Hodarchaeota archaeon]